jgi:uncharacterized protein (TIGR03435 family)
MRPWAVVLGGAVSCGLCLAPQGRAAAREFEVLSVKDAGTMQDHGVTRGPDTFYTWKPPELRGTRFAADASLRGLVEFACLPLVTPYRQEAPDWMRIEYYKIDAITPAGTDLDGARAMLRSALAKRLGLQYHIADRETPIYYLVRGSGPLRLRPSTDPDTRRADLASRPGCCGSRLPTCRASQGSFPR